MGIEIDEAHLAEATKCVKGFACQDNPRDTCCEIVRVVHDLAYYVHQKHEERCPYETLLGKISSCDCPVRKRIHNLYQM